MARLTNKHKKLIIMSLACYEAPKDIIALLKNDHNIEMTSSQLAFYNPETVSSARLDDKWRVLFHTTRERYREEIKAVPIAQKVYRLNMLQKNLDSAMSKDNIVLAIQILEQAAKEVGGGK